MALTRLLGSKATRSLTVLSVLVEAKRAFDHGRRVRAAVLLGVAAVAWKWAVLGMAAQGVVKLLRR
ncbi:hypothetical protein [Natronobiforma cellulositropha]|uniref:hypothetical protein n=1 Tax=Natronobiforma cellulositropha TaxID=1679076 RepID=UPI0021D61150|nr:hypothetical protein [Natronobiforma cellulositropha]